jgi:hypothetical protein
VQLRKRKTLEEAREAKKAAEAVGQDKDAVDQMSLSANAGKLKRKALEEEREAKKAPEKKKVQDK